MQDLDIKESFTDTLYFASGIIKSIKTTSIYNYNNAEYVALTGKSIENYRNGKIEFEDWYDNFGNNLKGKVFDKKGNLLSEMIATEINTDAENLDQFFESVSEMDYPNALISFKRLIKIYTYSKKSEKWYVYQEDHLTFIKNIKKGWVRKFLNIKGDVLKTKKKI